MKIRTQRLIQIPLLVLLVTVGGPAFGFSQNDPDVVTARDAASNQIDLMLNKAPKQNSDMEALKKQFEAIQNRCKESGKCHG